MEDEIKVGEALLDYATELSNVLNELMTGVGTADECKTLINADGTYDGDAKKEMELFFESLYAHLEKMSLLYQAAITYLTNTYQEMYYNEQQLAEWLAKKIEEEMNG